MDDRVEEHPVRADLELVVAGRRRRTWTDKEFYNLLIIDRVVVLSVASPDIAIIAIEAHIQRLGVVADSRDRLLERWAAAIGQGERRQRRHGIPLPCSRVGLSVPPGWCAWHMQVWRSKCC